jgi:Fe-S-cluster-containing dehydrogenase component
MDSQKVLLVDIDNCVRCHSCQVACRQEHGLSFDTQSKWCQVMTIGPRRIGQELHIDFVPMMCFQCDDPICTYFCPVNALSKRADGKVVIDEEACTGCRLCVYGCPYGNIFYNETKGAVGKCDLCSSRVRHGIEPACVQHCIGGALQFLTHEELTHITTGEHTYRMGMVYYNSSKWKVKGEE